MTIAGASATLRSLNQSFLVIIFVLVKKKVPFIEKSANRLALQIVLLRNSCPVMFCEKVFLKILQNSLEKMCQSRFFHKVAGITKEALAQTFSCEFCEIFEKTFFTEHLRAAAPF